jgi:hypothetical protein
MNYIFVFLCVFPSVLAVHYVPKTPKEALGLTAPPSGSQCSIVHLQKCQVDFNNVLNIKSELDWHLPVELSYALQNIYQNQGPKGVIKVCMAYNAFSQCLGNTYASCTNMITFIREGLEPTYAAFYPAIIAQLHFQCGGGLETLLSNWGCIGPGEVNYNRTVQICLTTYTAQVIANPAKACQYGAQFLQCVRAPYQAGCGMPAGWFFCEFNRAGIQTHLPYCPFRCRVSGTQKDELEHVHALSEQAGKNPVGAAMETINKSPEMKVLQSISKHAQMNANKGKK